MKHSVFLCLILSMASCSFSPSKENNKKEKTVKKQTPISDEDLDKNKDTDGDLVSDFDETELGRNPVIANLPEMRVRFLQDYSITGSVTHLKTGKEETFIIDTKTGRDDPSFKYRVGKVFVREDSFKQAANVARFTGHSYGEISDNDLSWVNYPSIDPDFFLKKVSEVSKYFNKDVYRINDIQLELENTFRLKDNSHIKEIINPVINYYYYDYEKESYELLESIVVQKVLKSGVNETISVSIENVPDNLISDNFLKKGEFIISELSDYEIPKLKTNYSNLIKSIKSKSLPVVYNTPLESKIYYVSTKESDGITLNEVLTTLFDKNFELKDNNLTRLNQFQTNLPNYTYLNEIKSLDKKGKWYIFTTPINKDPLKYQYNIGDIISVSYVTGSVLAGQNQEIINSHRYNASTGPKIGTFPLGNITPNSKLHLRLCPVKLWGVKKKHWKDNISSPGGSCGRNCIRRQYTCHHSFNTYSNFSNKPDLRGLLNRMSLIVNKSEFKLDELIKSKKLTAKWDGSDLEIEVQNINTILKLNNVDENTVFVRLRSITNTDFEGVKLTSMSGKEKYYCPAITADVAAGNKWPLSEFSVDFNKWKKHVNWKNVKRGGNKTYSEYLSVNMSSVIFNKFN